VVAEIRETLENLRAQLAAAERIIADHRGSELNWEYRMFSGARVCSPDSHSLSGTG